MKKSLLLAAAALIAMTASAQMRVAQKPAQIQKQATVDTRMQKVLIKDAQQLTGTRQAVARPNKVRPNDAPKYRRPAGTFYGSFASNFYGYGYTALIGKPYTNWEFKNIGEVPATNWAYWVYNSATGVNDSLSFTGTDFNYTYGYTAVPCPVLYDGEYSYSATQETDKVNGVISTTNGEVWSLVNTTDVYGTNLPGNYLVNPHYISGTRYEDESMGYSFTAYRGAKDADGGTTGKWFGKNYSGFTGFALGVEQPAVPYVLNKVYGYAYSISLAGDVELTCNVYRIPELPQYSDDGAAIDPALLSEENLIASGKYNLTRANLGESTSMMMEFPLEQYDPELDMSYSVTPEIDFPILIVVSGYFDENVNDLTFAISCEDEDEGWGEHTYLLREEEGVFTGIYGLDNFFVANQETGEGLKMKVGPTIFMDVSMPFLIYNFDEETGEYTFPNEGGEYKTLDEYDGVWFYGLDQYSADVTAEGIYATLEDGSEIPEWLTIEMVDVNVESNGQTYTIPTAQVTCAALPDGVEGREAKVKFYINGASLIYDFKQGTPSDDPVPGDSNGDGHVDITDVNAVINMMLGKAEADLNCDMNGDGLIDITDVNAVINKMLGK